MISIGSPLSTCPFCNAQLPLDLRPLPLPIIQCPICGAPFPAAPEFIKPTLLVAHA
jgi:hypothetical protein